MIEDRGLTPGVITLAQTQPCRNAWPVTSEDSPEAHGQEAMLHFIMTQTDLSVGELSGVESPENKLDEHSGCWPPWGQQDLRYL